MGEQSSSWAWWPALICGWGWQGCVCVVWRRMRARVGSQRGPPPSASLPAPPQGGSMASAAVPSSVAASMLLLHAGCVPAVL